MIKIGSIYRHYKSTGWDDYTYEIVCLGKIKDTLEDAVVYRALYPVIDLGEVFAENPIFIRTLSDFDSYTKDGIKRFQEITL